MSEANSLVGQQEQDTKEIESISHDAHLMQEAEIDELINEFGRTVEEGTQLEEHEVQILLNLIKQMARHMNRTDFDALTKKVLTEAEEQGLYDTEWEID